MNLYWPTVPLTLEPEQQNKRPRLVEPEILNKWYPWPNKMVRKFLHCLYKFADMYLCKTCTLDILMHLPRSTFSEQQLDVLLWLVKVNGLGDEMVDVPTVRHMKINNKNLQTACGIRTKEYMGAFGHRYYVNSLQDIIAQVI